MSLRSAALALAALAMVGCHACHDDHPYVPYAIGSEPSTPPTSDDAAAAARALAALPDTGRGEFAGGLATAAPPGLTRWPIEDVVLEAPEGRVFAFAVVRDFDADGVKDAFAIV